MSVRRRLASCVIGVFFCTSVWAQGSPSSITIPNTTSAINSPSPLSQRVVAYNIDAKYDARNHSLDATEVLTYRNLTGQPLDVFPFHLYLNGFQPTATWIRETKRDGTRDVTLQKWDIKQFGSEEIKKFEVVGQGDLTSHLQFVQPDDNNKDDRTVVQVQLPNAIPPDGYVQFRIVFHDQFPETMERTGWKRDFLLAGQWFPKVGVWWHGAWNCHQFHGSTEFFADFGVYDVKVTVPQNDMVAGAGVEVSNVVNPDGTRTVTSHGEDIHDFAWAASPHYKMFDDTFQGTMGPVKVHIAMMSSHWRQAERHDRILKQTMDRFERWYGPYPYKTITLVDPEPDSAAEGMEYPTFITGGTVLMVPAGFYFFPEGVVEHEYGHQYWYGMVATNEFEDAWMDEGINTYAEVKVLDSILGKRTSLYDLHGITEGDGESQRMTYIGFADLDPVAKNGWEYANIRSYAGITYGKTGALLLTLEGIIGEDVMQRAMHTYFMRYRFTHPTKEDFLKTIEEVSGKDLRWYFDQSVYGTQVLDYEVLKLTSTPIDWYQEDLAEKKGVTEYNTDVIVHRKGEFILPVDVEIRFDNGENVREHWDGKDRWRRYTYRKKAKVVSAEVDPDHKIFLDRNLYNDSRTLEANSSPARKLANYWMFLTQFFAQVMSWWLV